VEFVEGAGSGIWWLGGCSFGGLVIAGDL